MYPFKVQSFRDGLAVVFKDEDGRRRRFQLSSTDEASATAEAAEIVREFFKKAPEEVTTEEILVAYTRYLGDRPAAKRARNTKAMWRFFGPLKPSQINREVVDRYIGQRVNLTTGKPVSDETLWTELGLLRDAMSFAVKEKMINPEDKPNVTRPSKPQPRDRKLSRQEVSALLAAAEQTPHLFVAILLMLGTAGRVSAILDLTWDRVDFDARTIDLRLNTSGTRKGRAKVPMNPGLRRALLEWRKISQPTSACNHVIVYGRQPVKSLKTAFKATVRRANLSNVRPHDLRHTAAVWMLEAGSSIQRISQYLGHSTLDQTFRVYARYQPDFLRAEADALDVTRLVPGGAFGGVADASELPQSSGISVERTGKAVRIVVDRDTVPGFASFVESRASSVIEDLWREFYQAQ